MNARPLPAPSSCAHCGVDRYSHAERWTATAYWHQWIQPSAGLMATRYRALRATPIARRAR